MAQLVALSVPVETFVSIGGNDIDRVALHAQIAMAGIAGYVGVRPDDGGGVLVYAESPILGADKIAVESACAAHRGGSPYDPPQGAHGLTDLPDGADVGPGMGACVLRYGGAASWKLPPGNEIVDGWYVWVSEDDGAVGDLQLDAHGADLFEDGSGSLVLPHHRLVMVAWTGDFWTAR